MKYRAFTTPALLVLLAIILAACPSGQGASPAATPSPTPVPAVDDGEGAGASFAAGAGDLDAVLPDEVGGISIEYESASGKEAFGSEGMTPEAIEFFERVGATPSDITMAFGFGVDQEGGDFISIWAFRVGGANEDQLLDAFRDTIEEEGQTVTESNVAGKDVLVFEEDEIGSTSYLYGRGDVVFMVGATSQELAEEALSQLP